jgi:phage-related protein
MGFFVYNGSIFKYLYYSSSRLCLSGNNENPGSLFNSLKIKLSYRTTLLTFVMSTNKRELFFYKDYFREFYSSQTPKVQKKILWTLRIIEDLERIPEVYFKHIENTDGIYEIRVQTGSNIFRIFCFFDDNNLVIVGHGFQKKTQKTPTGEIDRAEKIKKEYHEEKQASDKPQPVHR